ncbi:tRNA (guanine-N(7)-)-methyltransferase (tRNA(m7G46)-methyltransferase), partial [Linderina pennispora]
MADQTTADSNQPKLPQKRYFRQRAHVNIFNDIRLDYPLTPNDEDWSKLYPAYFRAPTTDTLGENKRPSSPAPEEQQPAKRGPGAGELSKDQLAQVEFADIGCGYGGLLVALAPLYPNTLMVGMEIRTKVANYLQQRVEALRGFQHALLDKSQRGEHVEWVDVRSKLNKEIADLETPLEAGAEELHDNGEIDRL